jgi:tRNA-dihydrouridine synthase
MVGRGALGNPWIFAELTGKQVAPPTPQERWAVVFEHLQAHLRHVDDLTRGIRRFRPHLMWYARGLTGAASFRANITTIEDYDALIARCEPFFTQAQCSEATSGQDIEFEVKQALG